MRKIFSIVLISFILCNCGSPKQEQIAADTTTSDPEIAGQDELTGMNTLTEAERGEGWKLLFDGKTMSNWRVYRNQENDSWEVSDGTLHCRPFNESGTNKRADLVTSDQYENFELKFDWKITPQANTGVMFHVTEELQETYMTGPEFQIVDDLGYPGDMVKTQLTGANYHMYQPSSEIKVNAVGQWNESRLIVNKNHVEHWINGVRAVEYEMDSDDWKKKIATSKWKDFPQYGVPQKGHIALQDHRNEVWFRNLKIKSL